MTSTGTGRGLDPLRADIPFYTLTFGKGLSPTELLARMGIGPDTLALRDPVDLADEFGDTLLDEDEPVVTTGTDGEWSWAWEQGGSHGLDERILRAVSHGTEAVALYYNEKPMHWFKYAVDGGIVVDFHTLEPIDPTGLDPQRLDEFMRPLGLLPGQPAPPHGVLALAENAFGLRVTPPRDDEQRWSGSLLPLPEQEEQPN
ncbi:hypothetical protein HEK616_43870 [Streptomyces nigrescens]|uniref:Uncharacterized protein n=2 Tax=Streptomyces TaxID=1883 RepID=A0ABM7ZX17_STRNI|nr:DUF6461 domain-containing protein [Streptomyces nigrescens]MEE4420218.1 DUF6461 domain-containing protein [Streptomyces sp. DSM 41528]BDM70900.1 hypothetical protein HEK616_43870 [Streptomyces nigrescens]